MSRSPRPSPGPSTRVEWAGLVLLALFTLLAVGGYWVFALNPSFIPDSALARSVYGISFRVFARGHIVLAGLVLGVFLLRAAGLRWVPAFLAVSSASFLSEYIGTGYGFPFSGYHYTDLLGFKLGGRVPVVIPISWFLMALPAWVMASRVFPTRGGRVGRVLLAAYLLTAWDLALDPAMSHLTPYWVWEESGPFYGMPWVNLAGWFGTGTVIMVLMEILRTERWAVGLELRWLMAYYGLVLVMPLGMLVAAGLWMGVAATAAALSAAWGLSFWVRGTATGRLDHLALAEGSPR